MKQANQTDMGLQIVKNGNKLIKSKTKTKMNIKIQLLRNSLMNNNIITFNRHLNFKTINKLNLIKICNHRLITHKVNNNNIYNHKQ